MKKLLMFLCLFIEMNTYSGTWNIENNNILSSIQLRITYFYKVNNNQVISQEAPLKLFQTQKMSIPLPGCLKKVVVQPSFGKKLEKTIHCPLEGDKGGVIRFNEDNTLSVTPNQ